MKQVIIVRKDLNMSPGKLAAQCSHASMAFLTSNLRDIRNMHQITNEMLDIKTLGTKNAKEIVGYEYNYVFDKDLYEQWICGIFTKIVCEARNKNHLEKVLNVAKDLGLQENKDYFLIKDACLTELVPEEIDENGVGRTLTCIGFKPLPDDIARLLSKKYQLLK